MSFLKRKGGEQNGDGSYRFEREGEEDVPTANSPVSDAQKLGFVVFGDGWVCVGVAWQEGELMGQVA